jgi:hypothetical protein
MYSKGGFFGFFLFCTIFNSFICRPSDSTICRGYWEGNPGPGQFATMALAVTLSDALTTRLYLVHSYVLYCKNCFCFQGSFNVALTQIPAAFELPPEDFAAKYGFPLPDKQAKNIVLTCRSRPKNILLKKRKKSSMSSFSRVFKFFFTALTEVREKGSLYSICSFAVLGAF